MFFPVDDQGRKRDEKPADRYVWTPDEFRILSPDGHMDAILRVELRRWSIEETDGTEEKRLSETKTVNEKSADSGHAKQKPASLGQAILQWYASLCAAILSRVVILESPKDCLPLVFADDATALAERFELSVMENDEHYFLFARPKSLDEQRQFRETAVCLDRKTFIPIAKRTVLPDGDYYSYVVTSLRVNGEEIMPQGEAAGPEIPRRRRP